MFSCRICAGTPFGALFGGGAAGNTASDSAESKPTVDDALRDALEKRELNKPFVAPAKSEIDSKVANWKSYVHRRVEDLWEQLADVQTEVTLTQLAAHVNAEDDPILGEGGGCVPWFGEFDSNGCPVMEMLKVNENVETHVLRVLCFLFTDDATFQAIFAGTGGDPDKPLENICEQRKCVNIKHVVIPPEE